MLFPRVRSTAMLVGLGAEQEGTEKQQRAWCPMELVPTTLESLGWGVQ